MDDFQRPSEALARLGFDQGGDPSPEAVREAWVTRRSAAHPDRGGTVEDFHALKAAYTRAVAWALRPRFCAVCGGTGQTVLKSAGFYELKKTCPTCGGSGKLTLS